MTFKHINTLKEHKGAVYALCQGEFPHQVFSAGSDRHVIAWDLREMKAQKVIARSPTTIFSLCFIAEWNCLLIGQLEGGIHLIDLTAGKEVKYLKRHKGYIFDMLFIPEKNELVAVSGDGSFSVWSMPEGKFLYQEKLCDGKIRSVDYDPSQKELAFALGSGEVYRCNSEDFSMKERIKGFSSSVNVVRYNLATQQLFIGEKDALLSIHDIQTGQTSTPIPAHYWAIYDIAFHPNGLMATASRDKTIKIWQQNPLQVVKRFEGFKDKAHTHSVNKLLWISYQDFLISTGDDRSLKIWQVSEEA